MDEWEKLCPNLSFTIENKIENSYQKGSLLF